MSVDVIGSEIHHGGYLVALVVESGVPASALAEFLDGMANGTIFENDRFGCKECGVEAVVLHNHDCKHYTPPKPAPKDDTCTAGGTKPETDYHRALGDLLRSIRPFNKGGLIRFNDLTKIAEQLGEDEDNDQ